MHKIAYFNIFIMVVIAILIMVLATNFFDKENEGAKSNECMLNHGECTQVPGTGPIATACGEGKEAIGGGTGSLGCENTELCCRTKFFG